MARRVEVRRISSPQFLPFDAEEFWSQPSVDALAEAQHVVAALLDAPLMALTPEERADVASALADLDA